MTDRDQWHESKRRVEPPWRHWYKSPTWKSIRRHRLAEEPQCRQCAIEGRTAAASYVDHIEPHRDQWLLFFEYQNTQSLCSYHHHNTHKQQQNADNTTKAAPDDIPILILDAI